jgi:hypothetical protein
MIKSTLVIVKTDSNKIINEIDSSEVKAGSASEKPYINEEIIIIKATVKDKGIYSSRRDWLLILLKTKFVAII